MPHFKFMPTDIAASSSSKPLLEKHATTETQKHDKVLTDQTQKQLTKAGAYEPEKDSEIRRGMN